MSALLWGVAWILGAVLALVIVVLVTPVKLAFDLRTSPGWRLKVAARLLGGMTPAIPVHDSARSRSSKTSEAKPKKAARRKKAPGRRRSAARSREIVRSAPGLLLDLLKPIHLESLNIDAEVGLEDPADTGHLFGLIKALDAVRPQSSSVSIAVTPDFTGPSASGELNASLRFVPIAFVPPGVRFAWLVFGAGDDS